MSGVGPVRWVVLSTAAIGAHRHRRLPGLRVCGLPGGSESGPRQGGGVRGGVRSTACLRSYEELLASDTVDAVYVAPPVSMHADWTVKALEAGKHVLCEKPFALTAAETDRAFAVVEAAGLVWAEGFIWRLHPQTAMALRPVSEGAIGRLLLIRVALSLAAPEGDIRRTRALGGGALADLGGYCVSAMRLFAGEPRRVQAARQHLPVVPSPPVVST